MYSGKSLITNPPRARKDGALKGTQGHGSGRLCSHIWALENSIEASSVKSCNGPIRPTGGPERHWLSDRELVTSTHETHCPSVTVCSVLASTDNHVSTPRQYSATKFNFEMTKINKELTSLGYSPIKLTSNINFQQHVHATHTLPSWLQIWEFPYRFS